MKLENFKIESDYNPRKPKSQLPDRMFSFHFSGVRSESFVMSDFDGLVWFVLSDLLTVS